MGNVTSRLGSWPPDIDVVVQYGPHALAAAMVPAIAMSFVAVSDKVSDKEKEFLDRELEKRRKKLSEMCEFVDTHLKELAEKRAAHKKKVEEAKDGDVQDNGEDLEVKLRFGEIFECVAETEEIDEKNPELGRGLVLSAALMIEELDKFTRKTEEGDPQYRDGSELESIVEDHQSFLDAVRKMHVESQDKEPLKEKSAELWVAVRKGERVVSRIRNTDFIKAARLVMLAKRSLPWVGLSTTIAAVQGMLSAMEFLYRTQSLEIFRAANWKWAEFYKVTKAVLWTRGVTCALSILKVQVDAIGNEELGHIIRTEMYKALLRQDFEWYRLGQKDARNINEMFSSIFRVPSHVTQFIGTPMEIIKLMTNILTQLAIVRKKSSRLLYAMMAIYWIRFGCDRGLYWFSGFLARTFFSKIITPNTRIFMEPINPDNLQTVRSFGAEEKAISMWNVFWKSVGRSRRQQEILSSAVTPLSQAISESTTMAEHGFAGKLILEGDLKVAEMETTMHFSTQVSQEMHGAGQTFRNVNRTFAPLAKAWDIVSLEPQIGMEGGLIPEVKRAKGEISFENVSFKYPTGNQILRQVTFTVPAGHLCGITGESGGGKSTIFKLVERFYDVKEGCIKLDGTDIKELNPVWLRTQISVVSQKPRFMHLPLRENLAYGCAKEPSTEDIESACKAANIYELVFSNKEKFPAGLYTYVAESTLSGGELQRLSIARAILMDAPILFLDEATSALDSESQSLVNSALQNLMKGRTVLSIAHRLEAIKDANMIICLAGAKDEADEKSPSEKGDKEKSTDQEEKKKDQIRKGFTIAEQGTHAELVALGKVYAGLYNKQIEATSTGLTTIPENSSFNSLSGAAAGADAALGDKCPQGHQLQENVSSFAGGCDRCGQNFSVGTKVFSCRACNYDVCSKCMQKSKGPEEAPAAPSAMSVACVNELRRMQNDLQAETLDELQQQALAMRLEALIGRIEREDGFADISDGQAPGGTIGFRNAALKVIAANRFQSSTVSKPFQTDHEDDDSSSPSRFRSGRSAVLNRQCSAISSVPSASSVRTISAAA